MPFYKPQQPVPGLDPQTVFDANGNPLSGNQYAAAGGVGQKGNYSDVTTVPSVTPGKPISGAPQAQSYSVNPMTLNTAMQALEAKVKSNNALMTQRNLLLKQLYDQPLTPDEQKQLDPTLLKAVQAGDRNQIDMSLRLISDEIAGRNSTLDQSVQYLTQGYTQYQQQLEQNRQDAITNVENFINRYVSAGGTPADAVNALTALYGPQYVDQLKAMGINLQALETQANTPAPNPNFAPGSSAAVNNPLGLKPGGKFTAYSDMQTGFNAGQDLVQKYITRNPNMTLNQFAHDWIAGPNAPADTKTGYNGSNLAQYLSGILGVGVTGDTPISQVGGSQNLAKAVANFESPGWDKVDTSNDPNKIVAGTNLTQAAIDMAAQQYLTSGTMPSLGLGSSAQVRNTRTAILNRAAQLSQGTAPAVTKAKLASLQTTLSDQQKYLNTMQRAEATVDDNLQILLDGANKVNNYNSPLANEWNNLAKQRVIGSGDLNSYMAAIQTVRSEYQLILARGGQVTDSVRNEANTLIPDNITRSQLAQVVATLQAEAKNVVSEAQNQVDSVQSQMGNLLGGSQTNQTPPTGNYQDYLKTLGQ